MLHVGRGEGDGGGDQHADAGPDDAAARGARRAHAAQAEDEEQGGGDVADLDQVTAHRRRPSSPAGRRRLLLVLALEHLEHALGDGVAADRVGGAEQHGDEADDLLGRRLGLTERDHGADHDDAVHEVRARHQRRVQDDRHAADDLVAGEGGQHEDVDGGEAVDHDGASGGVVCERRDLHGAPHALVDDLAVAGEDAAREDLVLPVERELAVLDERAQEVEQIAAYWSEACTGSIAATLSGP